MNYPLTNPQNSIWLTEKFYTGTSVNNICGYVYISDAVNFTALKSAINELARTNDSMRLKFKEENNSCVQYLNDYKEFDIDIIELSSEKEIEKKALEMASVPFEMKDNFLFKFILFRLPDDRGGFIVNIHHIISDSWTLGLVAKEVTDIYSKLISSTYEKASFPSYLKYIEQEKEYINSDKYIKDQAYWNEVFQTVPEVASIPSMKDVPSKNVSCAGSREKFIIPEEQINSIKDFCTKNKISVYNFFMSAYSLYLGRVSNLDDFVVGTPILNRTNFEQKHTMGMFISTAPLRINLDHSLSFTEFSKKVATDTISILRHQKYPYQAILEDLRKKEANLPNLYNVVLSYQITKTIEENSNIKYSTDWVFNGCCADELQIHLFDLHDEDSITVAYDYKADKYDSQDINDLHNRILTVINQVIQNNDILLKDIEIVTPEEKHKILYEFNNTKVDYPRDKTIVDLFEEQVEKTPDNIAVVFEDQQLTYRELNEKANQLARYLIKNGIKYKDIVALRIDKSLEMIIGILAIIKSGACYLPMNMAYPEDRVNYMLEDSSCKILLTSEKSNTISLNINSINIDLDNNDIYCGNVDNITVVLSPEDLIYIIYTSGSTGKPKGAMLCHRNVVRLMKNDNYLFDFSEKDIWTMFHSVAFDFSVWEMYGALLYGGKLVLVPDNIAKDPKLFLDLLRKEKVTILNQTPSYFYNLQDVECNFDDKDLYIRYIIFGGEALNPALIKIWNEKYPAAQLINMYGITETTVHVTFKKLHKEDLALPSSNIGNPIPTLKVYVLDKNFKIQPFNTSGQLCVAGDGLCLGYLNRPDLNSTKFIKNPYIEDEILYLSGDNASLSPNGDLIYEGRIDNQFKLRGFRIELDEIESKILSHPLVSKCVVLPKKIDNKDTQLIAYIVCKQDVNTSEIKNHIYSLLPSYMIPSHFIKLDSIPLTTNGKTDRKKLLSIDISIDNNTIYVAPRNNFEKDCISIIENCLNIKGIGIDHNILDIGTDSLTLMRISLDLFKKSYIVNIQDFYEHKTIRNISNNLNIDKKHLPYELENISFNFNETFQHTNNSINNILLTGSTGFLGAHLLYDLIKNTSCSIYCLVRKKGKKTSCERLVEKLNYYFSSELDVFINNRIKIIEGDIALDNFGLDFESYDTLSRTIDSVLHSAALVSHYGKSSVFQKMNVQGTNNVIDFCIKSNTKLNYISTISVSGDSVPNNNEIITFNEHSLYIGQNCNDNIYIKTKFAAEKLVIEAIQNHNISATIYRLGNITARYSDLKFQENKYDNAFLNRMTSLLTLGIFPESYLDRIIDFSPVDYCSHIINKIALHSNCDNKIFHVFNSNTFKVSDLLELLKHHNYDIKVLSNSDFLNFISSIPNRKNELGIINDITSKQLNIYNNVHINSDFTTNFIKHLGLTWPVINASYILKFLKGEY